LGRGSEVGRARGVDRTCAIVLSWRAAGA
jgi:hypothetical protein